VEDGFNSSSRFGRHRSYLTEDYDDCDGGKCFTNKTIMCDNDAYVTSIGASVEEVYYWYDDAAVGDIKLHCKKLNRAEGG
jgi:hypothetical protein